MSSPPRLRICVGCRRQAHRSEFVRVFVDSGGEAAVDDTLAYRGRGAYLCRSQACLKAAVKSSRLARALRAEVPDTVIISLADIIGDGGI